MVFGLFFLTYVFSEGVWEHQQHFGLSSWLYIYYLVIVIFEFIFLLFVHVVHLQCQCIYLFYSD